MHVRTWYPLLGLTPVLALIFACSGIEPAEPGGASATVSGLAADAAPTPPAEPPQPLAEGCEPRPALPSDGRVSDPGGPYYHQVVVANTVDGLALTDDRQVLEHASVPGGVRLANGDIYVYYVNGEEHGVFVARLDGDEAVVLGPVVIDGIARPQGVVDPDATLLPDGTIRLVYLGSFGPPQGTQTFVMCIADSTDGINFTVRGKAIEFTEAATDPSIIQLPDGSWLMAVSRGQASVLARSEDGIQFTEYDRVAYGGVPELATVPGGDIRLYVCAPAGLQVYRSADLGETWLLEGTLNRPPGRGMLMCDPSVVAGTDLFIYKTAQ